MSVHCFAIPALNPEPAQSELNAFLARERVLAIRREFVADGPNSCWAFCVELAPGAGPLPEALKASTGSRTASAERGRGGVDYRAVLSDSEFTVFAVLRDLRKRLAQQDGLPVFAVFTNEQLAQIARGQVSSLAALAGIEGVGPARLDRYGQAVLDCVRAASALTPPAPAGAPAT